jgi:uncharacterized membrane protein AbrB (regulator of aidB expression)
MPIEMLLIVVQAVCMWDYTQKVGTKRRCINLGMNVVGFAIAFAYMLERVDRVNDWLFPVVLSLYLALLIKQILEELDHRK